MKTTLIIIFTLLFLVPPVPPKRIANQVKTIEVRSANKYSTELDSALIEARKKNKILRKQCLRKVQLLVDHKNGMEENMDRLAGD